MMLRCLLLVIVGYLAGSLPFSVWLTRMGDRDVRAVGDGNPGAVNAFKAAGAAVGIAALLLDFLKGALPVAAAYWLVGLRGWWLTPVILAPVIGHMFPLFLRFRGGKALGVTLGVWIGLTVWRVSLPAVALVLAWNAIFQPPGWAVMLTLAGLLGVILLWLPDSLLLTVLAGQIIILAWTHRADLRQRPRLRSWLGRLAGRGAP